jgi:hypothetical protein
MRLIAEGCCAELGQRQIQQPEPEDIALVLPHHAGGAGEQSSLFRILGQESLHQIPP